MKKIIIITFLLANIFLILVSTAISQDIARLKNINITESENSIDFNMVSSKDIKYNIINYMNGEVGLKLINTTLNNNLNSNNNIDVSKKESIEDATIIQEDPYSVVIKVKGNEGLKNKPIKVNNDIQKSNFIIIESIKEPENTSIIPLITDVPEIPEITTLQLSQVFESNKNDISLKDPISMYNEKTNTEKDPIPVHKEKINTEKYAKGKMLIAQAQPFSDDTTILDLEDKPLSTTSAENDLLTPPSNASELPKEETVDDLNINNTTTNIEEQTTENTDLPERAENYDNKETGIFSKIVNFFKTKWIWIISIAACGIIGFIILIIIISIFGNSQSKNVAADGDTQNFKLEEGLTGQHNQTEIAEIIDNEPVNYIPPSQTASSQSITDAINQIIFIRNKSGK